MPSRRGRKGPPNDQTSLYSSHISGIEDNDLSMDMSLPLIATDGTSPTYRVDHQAPSTADSYLIGIYYAHFHQAHPVLPPHYVWAASSPPKYLVDLMEYIGLHYLSSLPPSDRIRELRIAVDGAELSVEKIQGYLLLSVLLHGHEIGDGARECIGHAIECSLQLGLYLPDFSNGIETQNPAIAESIRRTWWEILVIDTLLAAVQRGGILQFRKEVPDMPLPRDEHSEGNPASSVTMKDMSRLGILTEQEHSSLAYRIDAALILRQCLIVHETHPSQESLDILDATITAWFHRWPSKRKAIMQFNGEVNQMDFQASMITQLATIYLHFPRSFLLAFLPNTCQVFCSGPPSFPSPTEQPQTHTAKVVSAAVELSKLVSLSTSVINHSPFTGCSLVVSSIVQMAVLFSQAQRPFGKHHSFLAVNIGVLHSMGATWTIAATAMGRLRVIAYEIETAFGGTDMPENMPFLSILQ